MWLHHRKWKLETTKLLPLKALSPCTLPCCSVLGRHHRCPSRDNDRHKVQHTTLFFVHKLERPGCTLLVASRPWSAVYHTPLLPRLYVCHLIKKEICSRTNILQYCALTLSSAHWYQQDFAAFCYILPLYRRTSCFTGINNILTIP